MRIENFRREKKGNRVRALATVIWEDRDRPVKDIYFETTEEFASDLACNPHSFLIACTIPAFCFGEKRVFLEAEICPYLQDGLMTAMNWLKYWYREDRELVKIEAKTQSLPPTPPQVQGAGFCFSGGIDSLATLRANRLKFPLEHPESIQYGLNIDGLFAEEDAEPNPSFQQVLRSLSEIATSAGITLLPAYTNLYSHIHDLDPDYYFWEYKFEAAALSAVAHAFSPKLSRLYIASTFDIPNMQRLGSHPVLDHHYSSSEIQVRHDGIRLSRLARTKLVADWDVGLNNIRVCDQIRNYEGKLNCGRCEKCIRTKLALLALGVLDNTRAFAENDISEELIVSRAYISETALPFYEELIQPLEEKGRQDLVRGIKRIITRYHEQDLKGIIKRCDRLLFNGNLLNLYRDLKKEKLGQNKDFIRLTREAS